MRSVVKEIRLELGANILIVMHENDDLPLPNIHRLAKTMQEYFELDGYEDDLVALNYKWRPTEEYWMHYISEISSYLAEDKKRPFCFVRKQKGLRGEWKFCSKKEYDRTLRREHAGIKTRTDGYNRHIDESSWELQLPHIKEVPLLTS